MRANAAGITWPIPQEMSDVELEKKLYNENKPRAKDKLNFEYLAMELKRPNVTKQLLWEEYKQNNPAGYQYSQFCVLLNDYLRNSNYSMRQIHKAGEKTFIDFGDGLNLVNPATGELTKTQLFVSAWGASNYTYCEAALSQNLENWINLNKNAFEYFGCVSKASVPDNLKSGVNRACRYEPEINPTYAEFAAHYNTVIYPARPVKPKDKAKVENAVLNAKRWILARLRNHIFTSLYDMNKKIAELLEDFNNRKMQKIDKTRRELFEELDKPHALLLPDMPYEFAEWKHAKVNINYHVEYDKHNYSVPYTFIGKTMDIKATAKIIEIFYKGRRIASHVRSYKKNEYTTRKEHRPQAHQKYLEWTPNRILNWASKIGDNVRELTELIMISRKFPEQGYRACLGIIRLESKFGKNRLNSACGRALKYNSLSYKAVCNILKNNLDNQLDFFEVYKTKQINHENIRGNQYYNNNTKQTEEML
jgi:transposase